MRTHNQTIQGCNIGDRQTKHKIGQSKQEQKPKDKKKVGLDFFCFVCVCVHAFDFLCEIFRPGENTVAEERMREKERIRGG